MKLNYYAYFFEKDEERYLQSLKKILLNFTNIKNQKFKNSFYYYDDNLYLFNIASNVFLFIMTKNDEIIKTIDSNTVEFTDIYKRLSSNEQLGFASYIYVDDYFYGIASTFHGPKNKIWLEFLDQILKRLKLGDYKIFSTPFTITATKEMVMNLTFKGKTIIEVDTSNNLGKHILGFLNMNNENNEIKTFEIVIKPYRKKQINHTFEHLAKKLKDNGIYKYIVKGKRDIEDQLLDYYIVGNGFVSDTINFKDENKIYNEILEKVKSNLNLKIKIREFIDDEIFNKNEIQAFSYYSDINNWNNIISDIE